MKKIKDLPINAVSHTSIKIKDRDKKYNGIVYNNERGSIYVSIDEKNEILIGIESERNSEKHELTMYNFSKNGAVALAMMIMQYVKDDYDKITDEILENSNLLSVKNAT